MERYQLVLSSHETNRVARFADILEQAGIPLMIQHVQNSEGNLAVDQASEGPDLNVLVPERNARSARSLLNKLEIFVA